MWFITGELWLLLLLLCVSYGQYYMVCAGNKLLKTWKSNHEKVKENNKWWRGVVCGLRSGVWWCVVRKCVCEIM